MDSQARRRLLKVSAFIAGAVLVGICALQYLVYLREREDLTMAIRQVRHELSRIRSVQRQSDRLVEAVKSVEEHLCELRLQVPANLDVEGFLGHVTALAGRFKVKVQESHAEFSSHDFYDQAKLSLTLAGDVEAVMALLEELRAGDRLTRYEVLDCADRKCDVNLWIFSIPQPKEEEPAALHMKTYAQSNSQVWLWPFVRWIEEMSQELEGLHEELQWESKTVQPTMELMRKLRLARFMEEVVSHLGEAGTPSSTK
jgi:hypothetical protein